MTKIYLIRHAEAEGNLYRRLHGQYNSLITVNGYRQIAALEARFEGVHIDAVYSSDMFRTMTTAESIYKSRNLPLNTTPDLRELDVGSWEDHTWGEIGVMDANRLFQFMEASPEWVAPDGESFSDVGRRVAGAIRRIAEQHPNQTIAIFCHGTAIRQATCEIRGYTPEQWNSLRHGENTAVSELTLDGDKLTVDVYCNSDHITHEISTLARQNWWKADASERDELVICFRPMNLETEADTYLAFRKEAWTTTHGDKPFDSERFLAEAKACAAQGEWGLQAATSVDGTVVGVLQLDMLKFGDHCGYINFFYLVPEMRGKGVSVQLLGGAISPLRRQGATTIRLRCAPHNERAKAFYLKHGFQKIGEDETSIVPLDIYEKFIGFRSMRVEK